MAREFIDKIALREFWKRKVKPLSNSAQNPLQTGINEPSYILLPDTNLSGSHKIISHLDNSTVNVSVNFLDLYPNLSDITLEAYPLSGISGDFYLYFYHGSGSNSGEFGHFEIDFSTIPINQDSSGSYTEWFGLKFVVTDLNDINPALTIYYLDPDKNWNNTQATIQWIPYAT